MCFTIYHYVIANAVENTAFIVWIICTCIVKQNVMKQCYFTGFNMFVNLGNEEVIMMIQVFSFLNVHDMVTMVKYRFH